MTEPSSRTSTGDAVAAQIVSLALAGSVMWVLHAGDHSSLVVLVVGFAFYFGVLTGMLSIGRARARRRDAVQRENFDSYLDERNHRQQGRD